MRCTSSLSAAYIVIANPPTFELVKVVQVVFARDHCPDDISTAFGDNLSLISLVAEVDSTRKKGRGQEMGKGVIGVKTRK